MSDKILGFRDPYAALTHVILAQWYEYWADDQPMLDVVANLERDVALQVLEVIRVKLDNEWMLNPHELREFILQYWETNNTDNTPGTYLH